MARRRRTSLRHDLVVLVVVLLVLVVPGVREGLVSAYFAAAGKVTQSYTDRVARDVQQAAEEAQRRAQQQRPTVVDAEPAR